MNSFKKLMDSQECDMLMEHYPNAFMLLTLIARRAKRNDCTADMDLAKGQAFIGDYKKCGLTEQKYRDAKIQLKRLGLASFKGTRGKGTIATILNTRVYDINPEQNNEKTADRERFGNEFETIKKRKKNKPGTNNKIGRNKEIINNNTGEFFEKFWEIYPRKIAKESAKKAFEKLNPDETLANSIIGSLQAQLKGGKIFNLSENMKYCPYASTWLNQGRYKDVPEDTVSSSEVNTPPEPEPEPDYEAIRERIKASAPELNLMFRKKVIEPLKEVLHKKSWEAFIRPLVIKSIDKASNTAFIYHGIGNSWVEEHFKGVIEEKLGMRVGFVETNDK